MAVARKMKPKYEENRQPLIQPTRQQQVLEEFLVRLIDKHKKPTDKDVELLENLIDTLDLEFDLANLSKDNIYSTTSGAADSGSDTQKAEDATTDTYPVRFWAALALGKAGYDTRAAQTLIQVFKDATKEEEGDEAEEDEQISEAAAYALARLGAAISLQPLLDTLANDQDSDVRQWAAISLGRLGDRRAAPLLEKSAVTDSDKYVRISAKEALEDLV